MCTARLLGLIQPPCTHTLFKQVMQLNRKHISSFIICSSSCLCLGLKSWKSLATSKPCFTACFSTWMLQRAEWWMSTVCFHIRLLKKGGGGGKTYMRRICGLAMRSDSNQVPVSDLNQCDVESLKPPVHILYTENGLNLWVEFSDKHKFRLQFVMLQFAWHAHNRVSFHFNL